MTRLNQLIELQNDFENLLSIASIDDPSYKELFKDSRELLEELLTEEECG